MAHAWNKEFFKFVVSGMGEFIDVDENTQKRKTMDVARILIRTRVHDIINFVERFNINDELFVLKVVEDWYAPLQWNKKSEVNIPDSSSSSSEDSGDDSDDESDGGADD